MQMRLQKLIAAAGFCSRRAAEVLITDGRVTVNGVVAALGQSADDERDTIAIDNVPLRREAGRTYIILNKPRGYLSSMSDDRGRKTVADLTRDVGARVFPVGRLDLDSEGLLLMTDDGELSNRLMHPSSEVSKTYHVRVRGASLDKAIEILSSPLIIDGKPIKPAVIKLLDEFPDGALLSVTITEGRNRQIRKMCDQSRLSVLRLKRVSEGGINLGTLPVGKWRFLNAKELAILQKHTKA